MIDLGIHSMFDWVEQRKEVDPNIIYDLSSITLKLSVEVTYCKLININTGAETSMSVVNNTHDIGENTIKSSKITGLIPTSGSFYLELSASDGVFSSILYSDGVINYTDCTLEIQTRNSCSDQYYDWDNELLPTVLKIPKYQYLEPSFEKETTLLYTSTGKKEDVKRLVQVNRFEFVAPTSWVRVLNGVIHNDTNSIKDFNNNTISVKNINVEPPEKIGDGSYSKFIVAYEYNDYVEGSTCCEILNIDDIAAPDYTGGGNCGLFAVTISEAGGVLTPLPTDVPIGVLSYIWYKDGLQIATSTTLPITDAGNYKVEAKVNLTAGGNCIASSTYYNPDECALFSIKVALVNNDISATPSNIPNGQGVVYSVKKDGVEVSAILPYTAVVAGTYFVHATSGDCSDIKGVYVPLVTTTTSFSVSITESNGILTAVNDATSPTYKWELETYNVETGISSKINLGTAQTQALTTKGIYHVTVTESGDDRTAYYLYDTALSVTITNLNEIATGSGVVQTIDNTTGSSFEFDYQNVRWLVFRNGVELTYIDTLVTSSLDIDEYTVIDGLLKLGDSFPLVISDVVTINPV